MCDKLQGMIPGKIAHDPATLDRYSRDASLFTIKPQAVAYPQSVADLSQLIRYMTEHSEEHLSLTPRAAGTDMTGGPLNESIIVDMLAFNKIIAVDPHQATVQPGAYYRDLAAALQPLKALLPSYPASRELCTVGGMVANNSGGEKTLAYGKTANYVQQLKVVLSDGQEYTFEKLRERELQKKIAAGGFLGSIYQQLFDLLTQHHEQLQRARPPVSKNSAGYALWDVWNPAAKTFDLTRLFCGSQGTLGIITEITFSLIEPKPHSKMLVIFLDDLKYLSQIIATTLTGQPESFESYDDHTLRLALRFLPDIMKRLATNPPAGGWLTLAWRFLPEVKMILTGGIPKLVLLAEFTGDSASEVLARARRVQQRLQRFPLKTRLITSPTEAKKYWVMRRESFNLLREHVENKRTAPFIDDIIVRPEQLPEFLPRLNHIMAGYNLTYTIAGHMGDANFHIIPLLDVSRPDLPDLIESLSRKVYDLVIEFNGSITAEHNDGLIRTPFLAQMYGVEIVELFQQVKKIFDPKDIFNPGKKVSAVGLPCGWRYATEHLINRN